jgi:endonuclease III
MAKNRKNGAKSAVRKAIGHLQIIEQSNAALIGTDEMAARVRRWVASHEAPRDDRAAFAKLSESIFAQGLGFEVVEKHHAALEVAFSGFAPDAVAQIDERQVGILLHEPIIRNRAKVEACIQNARRWQELVSAGTTYLGRIAEIGTSDDAATGWPKLVAAIQEDFCRLGEPTARIVLKRWGFFTALAHPGVRRALVRLGMVDADADGPAVQRFLGAVAEASGRDVYAVEAALAIFAGVGACRAAPRCGECPLNEVCPSAQIATATAL